LRTAKEEGRKGGKGGRRSAVGQGKEEGRGGGEKVEVTKQSERV
jgi:hypothetical protein